MTRQAGGGDAPAINKTTFSQTDNYLPLGNGDSDVAYQGSREHDTSIRNNAMIINKDCNNGSAYVSLSTVNCVQDDNVVSATQGESEGEELQC